MKTIIRKNSNFNLGPIAERVSRLQEERDQIGDILLEKWARVRGIGESLKSIKDTSGAKARNLAIVLENQHKHLSTLPEEQVSSDFGMLPHQVVKVISLGYPNSVRGDLFWEWPMTSGNDSIFYLSPQYSSSKRGATKGNITHESGDVFRYASEYNEQSIDLDATGVTVSSNKITITNTASRPSTTPIRPGSVSIFFQDGTAPPIPVAVDDRNGNLLGVSGSLTSDLHSVDYAGGTSGDFVEFTLSSDHTLTAADDKVIIRYAFDTEDSDNYDELGEVHLSLKEHLFRARPYPIKVSWSVLSELLLQGTLGVDAMDSLINAASEEITKSLDFFAVDLARKYAEKNDITTFDKDGATGESEIDRATAISRAFSASENVMYEAVNRGGSSARVCGNNAETFIRLHRRFQADTSQAKVGIYKFGTLDGVDLYKAPTDIIPTDKILSIYKNDNVLGDVSLAFGIFVALYRTQTLEFSERWKSTGLSHYGDHAVLQPKYLTITKIDNL